MQRLILTYHLGVGYDHDVRSVVYGGTAICFEEGVRNGSLVSIAK
ncbi:hypothetical protein [Moritella sp. 28]|nr:hypothetical protein [Moritella sp. 28]